MVRALADWRRRNYRARSKGHDVRLKRDVPLKVLPETSQCAANVPSARRTTDGTSAQFTKKCEPFATVCGADQLVPPRSENLSTAASLLRSIQLRSNRFPSTLNRHSDAIDGILC